MRDYMNRLSSPPRSRQTMPRVFAGVEANLEDGVDTKYQPYVLRIVTSINTHSRA
jgi:hypothetical protein